VARYLPGGSIEFIGRADSQVKVRGHRIELGEVEAVLSSHPRVSEAVAVVRGEGVDKRVVAYFVAAGDEVEALSVSELRGYMAERVPAYMIPQQFVLLDSLPLTSNGKVDRKALPEPGGERPELEGQYVAPRTELEESIAGLCADILGVERVGVYDNLFELGCNSIQAMLIVSRVRESLRVELPLQRLFEEPSVDGLTVAIAHGQLGRMELGETMRLLAELEQLSDDESKLLFEGESGD
jgi:aryl carrier-like protein